MTNDMLQSQIFMKVSNYTNLLILKLYFNISFLKCKNFVNFSKNNFEQNLLILQFSHYTKLD